MIFLECLFLKFREACATFIQRYKKPPQIAKGPRFACFEGLQGFTYWVLRQWFKGGVISFLNLLTHSGQLLKLISVFPFFCSSFVQDKVRLGFQSNVEFQITHFPTHSQLFLLQSLSTDYSQRKNFWIFVVVNSCIQNRHPVASYCSSTNLHWMCS